MIEIIENIVTALCYDFVFPQFEIVIKFLYKVISVTCFPKLYDIFRNITGYSETLRFFSGKCYEDIRK